MLHGPHLDGRSKLLQKLAQFLSGVIERGVSIQQLDLPEYQGGQQAVRTGHQKSGISPVAQARTTGLYLLKRGLTADQYLQVETKLQQAKGTARDLLLIEQLFQLESNPELRSQALSFANAIQATYLNPLISATKTFVAFVTQEKKPTLKINGNNAKEAITKVLNSLVLTDQEKCKLRELLLAAVEDLSLAESASQFVEVFVEEQHQLDAHLQQLALETALQTAVGQQGKTLDEVISLTCATDSAQQFLEALELLRTAPAEQLRLIQESLREALKKHESSLENARRAQKAQQIKDEMAEISDIESNLDLLSRLVKVATTWKEVEAEIDLIHGELTDNVADDDVETIQQRQAFESVSEQIKALIQKNVRAAELASLDNPDVRTFIKRQNPEGFKGQIAEQFARLLEDAGITNLGALVGDAAGEIDQVGEVAFGTTGWFPALVRERFSAESEDEKKSWAVITAALSELGMNIVGLIKVAEDRASTPDDTARVQYLQQRDLEIARRAAQMKVVSLQGHNLTSGQAANVVALMAELGKLTGSNILNEKALMNSVIRAIETKMPLKLVMFKCLRFIYLNGVLGIEPGLGDVQREDRLACGCDDLRQVIDFLKVTDLMRQYGVKTESYVLTGTLDLTHSRLFSQDSKEYEAAQEYTQALAGEYNDQASVQTLHEYLERNHLVQSFNELYEMHVTKLCNLLEGPHDAHWGHWTAQELERRINAEYSTNSRVLAGFDREVARGFTLRHLAQQMALGSIFSGQSTGEPVGIVQIGTVSAGIAFNSGAKACETSPVGSIFLQKE